MTSLADFALAFCRECLGRSDARLQGEMLGYDWKYELGHGEVSLVGLCEFRYTDLNAVMAAVRSWCDSYDAAMELAYHGFLPSEWEVRVVTPISAEEIVHGDLCHALLACCVEASRKLKKNLT